MYIQTVTLKGFQCFGEMPTKIELTNSITTLIGANGSGKTALLTGLLRLFGVTRSQRSVKKSDFHILPSKDGADIKTFDLWIDVRLSYPELTEESKLGEAVPACFKHMVVKKPGSEPFCRIRMESTWTDDGTVDGDITQKLYWITKDTEDPDDENKISMAPHERGLVQLHYLPASRDESALLKYATTLMAGRLLKAIEWSSETIESVQDATEEIQDSFADETGVKTINAVLQKRWSDLYDSPIYKNPELQVVSKNFDEIIRNVSILFHPDTDCSEGSLDDLSDGQKSLFYFSLAATAFNIERKIIELTLSTSSDSVAAEPTGFINESLNVPCLTIFGIEEPENHLAPYYLSRIIKQLRTLTESHSAQAIFTSHSPSILSRLDPSEIRHFRLSDSSRTAIISPIHIPAEPAEASKYVREAVVAYPELYFARFVILCEGDSEQVVLPRIASALELDVDPSFVAIVPLGGRHVNHFWRLLSELRIPYATLLDFDLGRAGAGWGRIKYVCEQLMAIGVSKKELLTVQNENGDKSILTDKELKGMGEWAIDIKRMKEWMKFLISYGVFFSYPLDLDMAMMSRFPDAYKSLADQGPRTGIEDAAKAVLGEAGPGISAYNGILKKYHVFFPWYKYFFLGKGKPTTHLLALSNIEDENLAENAPVRIKKLLRYADIRIKPGE